MLTLGGDGTLIRAARGLAGSGVPLVGINLGHLGYLTVASNDEEIPGVLEKLIADDYVIEERMMLNGRVIRNGHESPRDHEWLALNEIVVSRKTSAGPVHFRIYVNGAFLNEYKADGIIISTPTGSTAYNLSAGGPIIDPAARMTVLTPICPHSLYRASIVLRAEDVLEVWIPEEERGIQSADFDGAATEELLGGDLVRISESQQTTPVVRIGGESFFAQLRSKMAAL